MARFKMTKPTFGKVSPTKHSGAEMYSEENNPTIDRGHGREDQENMQTIIANRKKSEKSHDDFHVKNGPSHDVIPSWEKDDSAVEEDGSAVAMKSDGDTFERQAKIEVVDADIEELEQMLYDEEITQEEYDAAMKDIRPVETEVKQALKE